MSVTLESSFGTASDWCEEKLDAMLAADDLLYEVQEQEHKKKWEQKSNSILNRLLEKDDQKFLENEARHRKTKKSLDNAVKIFHSKQSKYAPVYLPSLTSLEEARAQYSILKEPKHDLSKLETKIERPALNLHRNKRQKFTALERIYSKPKKSWYQKLMPKVQRLATAAGLVAMLMPSMSSLPYSNPAPVPAPEKIEKKMEVKENKISSLESVVKLEGVFKNYVIEGREPYLTSSFGRRELPKSVRGSTYHLGNDYRARVGDRNISPIDGEVISINQGYSKDGKRGMSIAVLSSDSSLIVQNFHGYISKGLKVGSKVKAGDVLSIVAPKRHSGVDPHSHWQAIAVGGTYEKVAGRPVDVFCLGSDETQEQIISNLEIREERGLDLPTGLKYLPGKTIREKMKNSCELESYRISYGAHQLPTQMVSSKRRDISFSTQAINVY